jgi:hypothetical protein
MGTRSNGRVQLCHDLLANHPTPFAHVSAGQLTSVLAAQDIIIAGQVRYDVLLTMSDVSHCQTEYEPGEECATGTLDLQLSRKVIVVLELIATPAPLRHFFP